MSCRGRQRAAECPRMEWPSCLSAMPVRKRLLGLEQEMQRIVRITLWTYLELTKSLTRAGNELGINLHLSARRPSGFSGYCRKKNASFSDVRSPVDYCGSLLGA